MSNQTPPRKSAFGMAASVSAATKERPSVDELKKVSEIEGFTGRSGSITTQPEKVATSQPVKAGKKRVAKAHHRSMGSYRLPSDIKDWIIAVAYERRISQSDLIIEMTNFYQENCGEQFDVDKILKSMKK